MRRRLAALCGLIMATAPLLAQERGDVVFKYADQVVASTSDGRFVEAMPIIRLLGGEIEFSPAAGTYRLTLADHVIQFTPERRLALVDGRLIETPDAPRPSPGGVTVSFDFLERALLAPLGYHLEPDPDGYRVVPGARFAEPVRIRPAAADFGATTTVVLTLDRPAEATIEDGPDGQPVIHFVDATPMLDATVPFRSTRVKALQRAGSDVTLLLEPSIGILSWHSLDDPPRLILELGRQRPTPTPAPVRIVERTGPPPIVIDPGHGGDDTGAGSPSGLVEKDLTLAIARRLARVLESRGHAVRLTRDGDEVRALTDRTALANRLEAQLFVSLHANASTARSVRGGETYYMSLDRSATDDAAQATAHLENQAGDTSAARSPLDMILWDLAQSEVLNESSGLALAVQGRLNHLLGLRDRGVKQAPFVVLTGATMPAILVEVGFLSNPDEARELATADHQQSLAEAIALGIEDYLGGS
jgi:N-acetylmuramoyl-L-alanine amidase